VWLQLEFLQFAQFSKMLGSRNVLELRIVSQISSTLSVLLRLSGEPEKLGKAFISVVLFVLPIIR